MNSAPALHPGVTVSVSPPSSGGVEMVLQQQSGGFTNPRLFPGVRAILGGANKQRYIGLAPNGKTTLPEGSRIVGIDFKDGAKIVTVSWDEYPASVFYFVAGKDGTLVGFEPIANVLTVDTPKSLEVRGFCNLTAVALEGQRFRARTRAKGGAKKEATEPVGTDFRVLKYPRIEEGLRVMAPSLQFLQATVDVNRTTLAEGQKAKPKVVTEQVGKSTHALCRLPADSVREAITPRGYPKNWLTFAHLPNDAVDLVFMHAGIPVVSGAPVFGVHHLGTILAAAAEAGY